MNFYIYIFIILLFISDSIIVSVHCRGFLANISHNLGELLQQENSPFTREPFSERLFKQWLRDHNITTTRWPSADATVDPRAVIAVAAGDDWGGDLVDIDNFENKFDGNHGSHLSPFCEPHIERFTPRNKIECGLQFSKINASKVERAKRLIGGTFVKQSYKFPFVVRLRNRFHSFPVESGFFEALFSKEPQKQKTTYYQECSGTVLDRTTILTTIWCFMDYLGTGFSSELITEKADATRISVNLKYIPDCSYVNWFKIYWDDANKPKLATFVSYDMILLSLPRPLTFPLGFTTNGYGSINPACMLSDDDLKAVYEPGNEVILATYGNRDMGIFKNNPHEDGRLYTHKFIIQDHKLCDLHKDDCGEYDQKIDPEREFCLSLNFTNTLVPHQIGTGAYILRNDKWYVVGVAVRMCYNHIFKKPFKTTGVIFAKVFGLREALRNLN